MFIGHFGMGFGAKKFAPQVSLGVLFLACQLADLIWPNLVLMGIETLDIEPGITVMTPLDFSSYPFSHSLLALIIWAAIFAALYVVLSHSSARTAIVIAALVFSHWLLDVLSHRPDIPIAFGDTPKIGMGLWNHPLVVVPVELLLFGIGAWLYSQSTKPLNRRGSIGFWLLVAFLLCIYLANILGPPPPSIAAVAWSAQAMWLIVAWGFWIDRNRSVTVVAVT